MAAINLWWRASDASIQGSVHNSVAAARDHGFRSIAFSVLGAGVGGFSVEAALSLMRAALEGCDYDGEVVIVRFSPGSDPTPSAPPGASPESRQE